MATRPVSKAEVALRLDPEVTLLATMASRLMASAWVRGIDRLTLNKHVGEAVMVAREILATTIADVEEHESARVLREDRRRKGY